MTNDAALERITILLQAKDRDMARALERSNKLMAKFARDAERSSGMMSKKMVSDLNKVGDAAMGMGKSFLTGMAGGVAVSLLSGINTDVRGLMASLSGMAKEADRVGVSLDWWQALERGFGQAGVKAGEFTGAMTTFVSRLGDAADGSGVLNDVLAANGIALRGANGQIRPTIDLLREYAKVIGSAGSEAERLKLVEDAFGRGGRTLANSLAGGVDALDGFMRAAKDGGFILEEDLIRRAEVLDDRFDDITRKLGVMFKSAIVGAADLLTAMDDLDARRTRSIVGDSVTTELAAMGDAAAEHVEDIGKIRLEYERMAAESSQLANDLARDASVLKSMGYAQIADDIGKMSKELRELVSGFESGSVPAGDFERALADLTVKALDAYGEIEAIDRVEFSAVIAAIGGISRALSAAIGRAQALRQALPGGSNEVAVAKFIGDDSKRDQIKARGFDWQPDAGAPPGRPRAAPAELGFDIPTKGGGKGGGGGKSKGFADEVERTRARIADLQAESAILVALVAGNRNLADAMAYAKAKADLLAAAQKEGREVTPELAQEIDALALAYMNAGVEAEQAADKIAQIKDASKAGADALTDLFDEVILRGGSAKQAIASLLMEIAKVQLGNALMGISKAGGGGFFGMLGGLLTPKRAYGGPAAAGAPHLVNENTPNSELFVPSRSGGVLNVPQAQAALRQSAGGGARALTVAVTMDPSTGQLGAFVRDQAGRVVAQSRPAIVADSVRATYAASREVPLK